MAQNIKTFVVHLARATTRRPLVDRLLQATPFDAEIFDAVEGASLSAAQHAAVYSQHPLFAPAYPFSLGAGEIGCFLSHRALWQTILDQDLDAALILEDDLAIGPQFAQAVRLAADHIADLGVVQFQVRPIADPATVIAQHGGVQIIRPQVTPLRTSAQLVSQAAARHLLALTERFDRPVDTFLQMHWITGLPLACAVPSGVSDHTADAGGSTISRKTPLNQKLAREVKRYLYRRAVRRASRPA